MNARVVIAVTAVIAALPVVVGAGAARADFIDHFARGDDIGTLKVPRTGTTHVLVVPVIIDDLPFEGGSEQSFLDDVNGFYAEDNATWGLTPYYTTMSLGRYHPVATVAAPVHFPTCPPMGQYQDCAIPRGAGLPSGDVQGALAALTDAITFIDQVMRCATNGPAPELACTAGGGVRIHEFDTSGPVEGTPDGVADGVILVSNAGFPGIALPVRDLTTGILSFLGPFPSLTYDGVIVGQVAIAGREVLPAHATFVSAHEFGHLLGWCDLYNDKGTTSDMPYTLMGGWYYQDPGSLVDGYSRMAAGYAHVVQAAKSGTYDLEPSDASGTILKVGTGDEFFTVELRRKVDGKLDGDMTVPFGVIVERVRLQKRPSATHGSYTNTLANCANCTQFDTFLSIEQADKAFDLDNGRGRDDAHDLFQAGDEIGPSDDVQPRSAAHQVFSSNRLDGTATGLRIRVVDATADHATIDVTTDDVADPCAEIAPYCGKLTCSDGECGKVIPPPPVVTPPVASCTCATSSPLDAGALALCALALRRRRRVLTS